MPHARYIAAVLLVALESCGASYGKVICKCLEQNGKHKLKNVKASKMNHEEQYLYKNPL